MHWPSRKSKDAPAEPEAAAPAPAAGSTSFSAPPSSAFSAPPPSTPPEPAGDRYASMDFSRYGSNTYESDGLRDAQIAQREQYRGPSMIDNLPPRARNCINSIQIGAKMGASVGGCFGLLTGMWVAVTQRNPLILPVSVVGGAVSFGFFLGC